MSYQDSFLTKCRRTAQAYLDGVIDEDGFAARLREFYSKHEAYVEKLHAICQSEECIEASARGVEVGAEGIEEWELGFRRWFDFLEGGDEGLIEEGLAHMQRGNDLFNNARDHFLDASEDGEVRFWV